MSESPSDEAGESEGYVCHTCGQHHPELPMDFAVELEPIDHPSAVEQRHGITMIRVREIAAALLYRSEE